MPESEVKNSFECSIHWPSMKEFVNFSNYIESLGDISFALIAAPKEWSSHTKEILDSEILPNCITQSAKKLAFDCFDVAAKESSSMTYKDFKTLSEAKAVDFKFMNISEAEDMFWSQICSGERVYCINNPSTLFGDETDVWNLDKFTKDQSNIHSKPSHRLLKRERNIYAMEGIQTPVLYVGAIFTLFPWHLEDGNLCSINYMHTGHPKFWYIIHKDDSYKFETLTRKIVRRKRKCSLYIRHKTLMIPPSVLEDNGIRFTRVVQRPGQFMVTWPNVYHAGFNLGFNIAESINFGTKIWLQMFKEFKACSCKYSTTTDAPNRAVEKLNTIFERLQTKFICKKCDKEFVSEVILAQHKSQHKKRQEIFKCTMCHVTCTSPYTLRSHMKTEHKKNIEIQIAKSCAIEVTFSTKVSVIEKKKITKNKMKMGNSDFICQVCGKIFCRRFNLKRHEIDFNHILSEAMPNSIEIDTEVGQPSQPLTVSVENRYSFAPNTEQETVDYEQNVPEPSPGKVEDNPTKKNIEPIEENVLKGIDGGGAENPVTSKEPVKSAVQSDYIEEKNARRRKRAASAVYSPAEKSLAKKNKIDTTATSTAVGSTAKTNGTSNKAGIKADSGIASGHPTKPDNAKKRGEQKEFPKKSDKNEPCRKTLQMISALPLKITLPRIPKISHGNIAQDRLVNLTPNFERLRMKDLLTHEIPEHIRSIEFDNDSKKLDYLKSVVREARIKENSYIEAFTAMVQLEEAAHSKFLKKFDIENVRLHLYARENQIFQIQINANQQMFQKACRDSLLDGFTVKQLISGQNVGAGQVVGCRGDSVYIQITQGFEELSDFFSEENQRFTLNFFTNRSVYKVLLNTLEWFKKHKLHTVLVNNELYDQVDYQLPIERNEQKNFKCSISEVLNEEQKSAVQQIVWGENDKVPILLHGPPGTGKTLTLVASIAEIVQGTIDHVLVLAQTNAACDEITVRLTEVLRHGELYRLYAKSFDKETLCDKIKPICNLMNGEFQLPALKHLYGFRVVVSTLSTSGCLVRARGEDQEFDSSHFRRIIIDEAGCTHEISTMIPIAGLCSENGVVNARIVLSGDPKQLDAVTKSENAIKLGYKTSWMEYLMTNKICYTRHPISRRNDPRFITVLKKNYRSHPDILAIPNKLFYDGVLEAEAKIDQTHGIIANQLLPNSSFPLVFESVNGECEQEFGGTSYFNEKEVRMVIEWIQKLSQTEWKEKKISPSSIGVVSPYKKQCELIRNELSNNGFRDVMVGTAELYQGKEKHIIIISTVRTGNPLGFISNEQRINVMVTRAIGLLIIVGNHEALSCDRNWAALIEHCNKNGALIREKRTLYPRITAPE